jgi:hypothetical protein
MSFPRLAALVAPWMALPALAGAPPASLPDAPPQALETQGGVWLADTGALNSASLPVAKDVKPQKRVTPRIPPEARKNPSADCVIWLRIDEQGVPYEADVTECPDAFKASAREAAAKWRFDTYAPEGKALRYLYRLNLLFKTELPAERHASATSAGVEILPRTLVPENTCPWGVPAAIPEFVRPHIPAPEGGVIYPLDCMEGAPPMATRLHPVDLALRVYTPPEYTADTDPGACRVRVYIDEMGVPYNVTALDCPANQQAPVQKAVRTWRFVPPLISDTRRNTSFLLEVRK